MSRANFDESLKRGEAWEKMLVAAILKAGGETYQVGRSHLDHWGPLMYCVDKGSVVRTVLIDTKVWLPSQDSILIEAKWKTAFVRRWSASGIPETGFDEKLIEHYLRHQDREKARAYIAFRHESETSHGLLIGALDDFNKFGRTWNDDKSLRACGGAMRLLEIRFLGEFSLDAFCVAEPTQPSLF